MRQRRAVLLKPLCPCSSRAETVLKRLGLKTVFCVQCGKRVHKFSTPAGVRVMVRV